MISIEELGTAVVQFERLSLAARERLAEQVHARQPNLLASIVVLQRYGATLEQMEVAFQMLMVFFLAIEASGTAWPLVSEDVQERCLVRVCARARFLEGLTPDQQVRATADALADHPQQPLLAYVFGTLCEHGWDRIETEAEKMLLLATVNLVECIGETARRTSSGQRNAPAATKKRAPKR